MGSAFVAISLGYVWILCIVFYPKTTLSGLSIFGLLSLLGLTVGLFIKSSLASSLPTTMPASVQGAIGSLTQGQQTALAFAILIVVVWIMVLATIYTHWHRIKFAYVVMDYTSDIIRRMRGILFRVLDHFFSSSNPYYFSCSRCRIPMTEKISSGFGADLLRLEHVLVARAPHAIGCSCIHAPSPRTFLERTPQGLSGREFHHYFLALAGLDLHRLAFGVVGQFGAKLRVCRGNQNVRVQPKLCVFGLVPWFHRGAFLWPFMFVDFVTFRTPYIS